MNKEDIRDEKKIIRNSFHCKKCGMDVESKSIHHFAECDCHNFTDGGKEYIRRGGSLEDMEDTSIVEMARNETEKFVNKVLTIRQEKTIKRWLTLFGKDEIKPKNFTYFEMKRGWKLKTVWKDQQGFISDFELQMPYKPLTKLENGKTYSIEDLLFGGEE